MSTSIKAIECGHVFRESFFAIEKYEFQFCGLFGLMDGEVFGDDHQCGAGRGGIICAMENFVFEEFRIHMGAEKTIDLALPWVLILDLKTGAEVGEFDFSHTGIAFEFLKFDHPAVSYKFFA